MRILQYTPRFFPDPLVGGRAVSVRNFSLALARRGHEVTVVSHWRGGEPRYRVGGVDVVRAAPLFNRRLLDYLYAPLRELRAAHVLARLARAADLLHVHGPTYGFRVPPRRPLATYRGWTALKGRLPIVYTFEGSLETDPRRRFPGYGLFERNAVEEAGAADAVVALNSRTAARFKELLPGKRVEVVYNFVGKAFLEAPWREPPRGLRVLYVGGHSREKGYLDARAVEKRLREMGVEAEFTYIGPGLRKIPHEEMPGVYAGASVLLFPSYREGLPMSVIEAQAVGRPVVASNVGGIPDIVVDGETGFLLEPGDVEGMAERLAVLAGDRGLVAEMGRRARSRARGLFSEERVVPRLESLYRELL